MYSNYRYDATSKGRMIERLVFSGSSIRDDIELAIRLDPDKTLTAA